MTVSYARSSEEAHIYMDLHPCACGEVRFARDSALLAGDAGTLRRYTGACSGCGRNRDFMFRWPTGPQPRIEGGRIWIGGDQPSELVDAGQWLLIADSAAERSAPRGEPGDRARAVELLDYAQAAVGEAAKFVPQGADAVPGSACWTEMGRRLFDARPDRFLLSGLGVLQERYRQEWAQAVGGDTPRPAEQPASQPAHEVTFFAWLPPGGNVTEPRAVLRRLSDPSGPVDEALGPDGEWQSSDIHARVERGDLPGTVTVIAEVWAKTLVDEARADHRLLQDALRRQAEGGVALRLAGVGAHPGRIDDPWDADERRSIVAYLREAPSFRTAAGELMRTDGMWVWSEPVADAAEFDDVAPEPEFLYHIRQRRCQFPAQLEPGVFDRAARLAKAGPDGTDDRVRETAAPGQATPPTQEERLRALSAWHAEWSRRHGGSTPFRPENHPDDADYALHHVDIEASGEAEWEFTRRAREIMGLDPDTGRRVAD
ncbi:hypothetical protein Lfu02_14160 [Longispora fulva]|uniref:Uncharacterized protein n=1 Tax=Longispora fulva TaxID=619741 RepID=A0A8J7GJK6_9ACTN|nr:hypothetical protein [Longispora fulva]MBG6140574.1 hypothetical protein [Longispora fulva]GIG57044.1 hypothetical protein Lfu02_14160 [Longispora fulva]